MGSLEKCRPPVGCFSESNDGNVFFARGDQNVKRWDGLIDDWVDAGVPAPSSGVTLSKVESDHAIIGTYYGYLRFLDSRGKVSNLSLISNALSMGGARSGVVEDYIYTGRAIPVRMVSVGHGLSTGARIRIAGGSTYIDGDYRVEVYDYASVYLYHRLEPYDSSTLRTRMFYGFYGGATWKEIGNSIKYENVEIPTDPRVVRRQILRNKDGNVNTFYVDVDDTDLTDTEFVTTKEDYSLGEEVPLRANDGTDLNVSRHSEPPSFKRVLVDHYSRTFAAVNLVYRIGSASVTNESVDVTGNGTCWTSAMVGRNFTTNSASTSKTHVIATVDSATQSLTLASEYDGDTGTTERYSISPANDDQLSLHFSEATLPESWDRNKVLRLTDDPLAGEITGLMSLGTRLHILFAYRTFSLNYNSDPSIDGQISFTSARGCVNHKCWVRDGSTAFLLDERGIYAFNGSETTDISAQIQAVFTGDSDYSIDWTVAEHFHASHEPSDGTIRWFVSLTGYQYPHHAFTFNYQTKRWWIEEYPEPMTASALGAINQKQRALWCGTSARAFSPGLAPVDGLQSSLPTRRGRVGNATSVRMTDNDTVFDPAIVGAPIHIAEGRGVGQTRIIVSVSDSTIEIDRTFSIIPDTTSIYQIGGFRWKYRTPMMMLASPPGTKALRSAQTRFEPTAKPSTILLRKYNDFGTTADVFAYTRTSEEGDGASVTDGKSEVVLDSTLETGSVFQAFDGAATPRARTSRAMRLHYEGVPNGELHKIYMINVEGVHEQ